MVRYVDCLGPVALGPRKAFKVVSGLPFIDKGTARPARIIRARRDTIDTESIMANENQDVATDDQEDEGQAITVLDDETVSIIIERHFVISNSTVGETDIDLAEIPVESIMFNLKYGFGQYMLDGAATTVNEKDDKGEFILDGNGDKVPRPEADVAADKLAGVKARIASIFSGIYPTGGGGRALSAYDNELRALVKAVLLGKGIKLADATKAAKSPMAAVIDLALTKAKATVPATAPVEGDKEGNKAKATARKEAVKATAQDLFDTNWKVLTDKATDLAAQHKAVDVDL